MSGVKVIGYVRVSRVGGREGDSFISPALQREQIEAVARREGLTVARVIEELDASGGDAKRPGWNEAIEAVESGEARGVVDPVSPCVSKRLDLLRLPSDVCR